MDSLRRSHRIRFARQLHKEAGLPTDKNLREALYFCPFRFFYTGKGLFLCIKDSVLIDPTSGSGSLLINIGKSVAKYMADDDNIKYYAQELKENTYNLTRMNTRNF